MAEVLLCCARVWSRLPRNPFYLPPPLVSTLPVVRGGSQGECEIMESLCNTNDIFFFFKHKYLDCVHTNMILCGLFLPPMWLK